MKRSALCSIVTLSLLTAMPAFAADRHGHADLKPAHGGIMSEAGGLDLELVAKADSLTLYLADDQKPVASAGVKAMATVYAGGDKTPVDFTPNGDNTLIAKGSFKTGVGVRVAVVVSVPGKPEAKATFKLK